ncbi:hypothetical protein K402DRAFT_421068 [Aulographum hederae CBS 113979]|uniref:DUF7598 domain-containing protein n=1 Tax=Aulographum hederae CBS 113979 TaxID=1176131 RepID=A0A6G1H0V3_9PEZI|nr:hypothetical protein K402DRAFT_421068 [Aulographum hederae CBS 113979]
MAFRKKLAGSGYIILNILRVMNIIGLLAIVAASVVMLVKTVQISKFFFFDGCSHVITALSSLFLIVSELPIFRTYFATNWPLLSASHGFVTLGAFMIVIGLNILGNLNKEATSQKSLGMAFWNIVIASGIIVLVLGVFNIIASYIFRDSASGISARRVRSHGAVADHRVPSLSINTQQTQPMSATISQASSFHIASPAKPKAAAGGGLTSPIKAFSPIRSFRAARDSILPSYYQASPSSKYSDDRPPYPSSGNSTSGNGGGRSRLSIFTKQFGSGGKRASKMEISAPMNVNPQFAHLVKPNLAHHPSTRRADGADEGGNYV